jgi:hypothetical protein
MDIPHPLVGSVEASTITNHDWELANCQGIPTNAFFYSARGEESTGLAWVEVTDSITPIYDAHHAILARVCTDCEIMAKCFLYALKHEEFG